MPTRVRSRFYDVLRALNGVTINDQLPFTETRVVNSAMCDGRDETFIPQPVCDQISNRPELYTVLARERLQIRHTRHCTIVVHDLANYARGIESCNARNIDCDLRVACAH